MSFFPKRNIKLINQNDELTILLVNKHNTIKKLKIKSEENVMTK